MGSGEIDMINGGVADVVYSDVRGGYPGTGNIASIRPRVQKPPRPSRNRAGSDGACVACRAG
ncbi:MAG: hypothetical protein CME06_15065 [Gemmatimonadetes bacterium]|nr:hypothetical protein [Gemmatimonadota bacterium]